MKKILLMIGALFFNLTVVYANVIDSLKKELLRKPNDKFELSNMIAWEYVNFHIDSAELYYNLAVESNKTKHNKGQLEALKAAILFVKGSFKDAEDVANKAILLPSEEIDFSSLSSSYNTLAKIKMMEGDFKAAELNAQNAYFVILKTNNKKSILKSLINYGSTLLQNGKIEDGIVIYRQAEKYFYIGSEFEQGYIYYNLARIFLDKSEIIKTIGYLDKSIAQFDKINYYQNRFDIELSYAEAYLEIKNVDKCFQHLDIALKEARNQSDTSDVYFVKGSLFFEIKSYQEANYFLTKAIKINEQLGELSKLGEDYIILAKVLLKQNQFDIAEAYLQKSIGLFKKNEEDENLRLAFELIILNFLHKNKANKYSDYFIEYTKLTQEKNKKEREEAIFDLDKKYQTSEKEAQIAQQQLKIEQEQNKRNMAFAGSGILLLIAGGGFFWYSNKQKRKALQSQNDLLTLTQKLNQKELSQLNAQLDPHEIKNLLASISPEIQQKAPETYQKMLGLFNITKSSLNNAITEDLQIQLAQVTDYLNLMKDVLFEPITFKIDNDIKRNNVQIPRLLLKNLVENAVKHGIKGKKEGGSISIQAQQENNIIKIVVDDTGKGRLNAIASDSGIGTATYQKLFEILNTKNKAKATFEIIDKTEGTQVVVKIPDNYQYE